MPSTEENLAILSPFQYKQFKNGVKLLATKYNTTLDSFDDIRPAFTSSDFLDSAHLNKQGALRFVPLFSRKLVKSSVFKRAFQSK